MRSWNEEYSSYREEGKPRPKRAKKTIIIWMDRKYITIPEEFKNRIKELRLKKLGDSRVEYNFCDSKSINILM